jgi:hypothetical protein
MGRALPLTPKLLPIAVNVLALSIVGLGSGWWMGAARPTRQGREAASRPPPELTV